MKFLIYLVQYVAFQQEQAAAPVPCHKIHKYQIFSAVVLAFGVSGRLLAT